MPNTFLTQEGFDKLQEELDYLRTTKRQEVADRLREAADGEDLIENAEYEAAKNEQAFVEGRIQELEILLATAKIIPEQKSSDNVQVGSKVVIQEEGLDDQETFVIVGAAEARPKEGRISNESPLGRSLIGHKKGDMVAVEAPDGKFNVKIIKVS
ncbi:MAG TPA: transcription elongation factor GreA [Pelolinea sp.]|nr:transcription elongation factor GreA [Pelolinea sp.]